jgi:epoxyqueuosine reductase QueG
MWLRALRAALEPSGLNHVGVVSRARYDAAAPAELAGERLWPGTRSVVVIGSGGGAHFDRFLAHVAADPVARLARSSHPLDDFCAFEIARLGPLGDGCRAIFPSLGGFDFMRLAELAGLGAPSEIGTLVSERFGPWFGLRVALFTPHALDDSPPARRLCDGCHAPCRAACPVAAVGPRFDWRRCVDERLRAASSCRDRCHSRRACVVAPEAAYDALELTYHYDRTIGRRRLCERFGVRDEAGPG